MELALPLGLLGNADTGDRLSMRAFFGESLDGEDGGRPLDLARVPFTGPAVNTVPNLGTPTTVLEMSHPEGDNSSPGTCACLLDGVCGCRAFDLTSCTAGFDESPVTKLAAGGPVEIAWWSPNGLSMQTFDM